MGKTYRKKINLDTISDQRLLGLKISELPLDLKKNKFLMPLIKKVKTELKQKNIKIKLNFYLSDEWFCVNNTQSIAIPFYLAHPRLIEIERQMMGTVEGANEEYALKLLRHEVGHVIDNSFPLKKRKERVKLFGKASMNYPASYSYRPYSRNFVKNLNNGYAQSHPTEDFAETFAVWLNPSLNWKKTYKNWPAFRKLEYMNDVMHGLEFFKPLNQNLKEYYSLSEINIKLEDYYKYKRKKFFVEGHKVWDSALIELAKPFKNNGLKVEKILKDNKIFLQSKISSKYSLYKYQASSIMRSIIDRSRHLNLCVNTNSKSKYKAIEKRLVKKVSNYFFQKLHFEIF